VARFFGLVILVIINRVDKTKYCYRAFHGFGQAKFPDGSLVLGSSQFSILPQLPQKSTQNVKVAKFDSKIIISIC